MTLRPSRSTLFPYTTLFRSRRRIGCFSRAQACPYRLCDGEKVLLVSLRGPEARDRKSTRLNSSHLGISYAVFCLKKKRDWAIQGGAYPRTGKCCRAK